MPWFSGVWAVLSPLGRNTPYHVNQICVLLVFKKFYSALKEGLIIAG